MMNPKIKFFIILVNLLLVLDKIDPLMKDPNIEDISCDGSGVPIFLYHRKYGSLKSNVKFDMKMNFLLLFLNLLRNVVNISVLLNLCLMQQCQMVQEFK